MVFTINSKSYNPILMNFPRKYSAEIASKQSLNKSSIDNEIRVPDPIMYEINKDTQEADLGKLTGEGFKSRISKQPVRTKNDKLRKFISLKI